MNIGKAIRNGTVFSLLAMLAVVIAGCQSNENKQAALKSFELVAGEQKVTLPGFMSGSWQDGIHNGPVEVRIQKTDGGSNFEGTMAFVGGTLPGCPTHTKATGMLQSDGTLVIRNGCNGGTVLKLEQTQGGWRGEAQWGGNSGSVRGLS